MELPVFARVLVLIALTFNVGCLDVAFRIDTSLVEEETWYGDAALEFEGFGFPKGIDDVVLTFNHENNAFWLRSSFRDPKHLDALVESLRKEAPPQLCVPFKTGWWEHDGLADVKRHPQRVWYWSGEPLDGYVTFDHDTLTVHAFHCGGQQWIWP